MELRSFLIGMARAARVLAISATSATIVNTSLYTVDTGERAVVFDRFRGVLEETVGTGTHFKIPWLQQPHFMDTRTRCHSFTSTCGSKDLQMVNITVRILSRPQTSHLSSILEILGNDYNEKVLPSIVIDEVQTVVSGFSAQQLVKERKLVSALIRKNLKTTAMDFWIIIDHVAITELSFNVDSSRTLEQKQEEDVGTRPWSIYP